MVFEQARALGFIYALVMFFILAYLWYTKRWTRRIGWVILLITVALGFLIFSPIIPWQFQSLVLRDARGVGGPLTVAAAGLIVMLVLSFVFGRFYCGYLCPVGAVQELASLAPVSKVKVGSKVWPGAIRWIFFYPLHHCRVFFHLWPPPPLWDPGLFPPPAVCRIHHLPGNHRNLSLPLSPLLQVHLPVRGSCISSCHGEPVQDPADRCLYLVREVRAGVPHKRGEEGRSERGVLSLPPLP